MIDEKLSRIITKDVDIDSLLRKASDEDYQALKDFSKELKELAK